MFMPLYTQAKVYTYKGSNIGMEKRAHRNNPCNNMQEKAYVNVVNLCSFVDLMQITKYY